MCGIAGIVYRDPEICVQDQLVEDMCSVIHHRGPDEGGLRVWRNAGIGMRRLSIIDVAGGSQPIHNEDRSVWIVFNGEIYNYNQLRKDLQVRGHRFYTNSDTESIVHLYEEVGENCVDQLRGMFAFAIWDQKQEKLFLARDRLGIKPLYYFDDGQRLIFGSEIKSLLAVPNIPRKVKLRALVNYFAYGYVPEPDTIFEGFFKLPPGNFLTYQKGNQSTKQYWELNFNFKKPQPEMYYVERILDILSESIKMRLISEVPLGAFLSGGIDSSMVVGLMAREMSEPVKTFSIGFEESSYSELKHARVVSDFFGTDHHEEIVKPDARFIIEDLVNQFDEPFADSSAIPTYYLSKVTRKHVTVALSGDGGDELFGGYDRYLDGSLVNYTRWIPDSIKRHGLLKLSKLMPEWFPGINTLRHIAVDANERYIRYLSKGVSTIYKSIFSKDLLNSNSFCTPSVAIDQYMSNINQLDNITKRRYVDTKTYLPGDILTKVDRTSMLVSLEVRVPVLDHKFVEFVATIPPELIINGKTTKYIFKKAAERILPKGIVNRKKMGFAVPINIWLKREWSEISHELVLGDRALARNNFNLEFIKRIMREHKWGRRDHSYLIYTLMILEMWYRKMID